MKIGISLCLGVLMCLNAGCTGKKSAAEEPELTYSNPLSVQFGDPYVLLASDGRYYMYGTGAGAVDGFCAYSSDDLIHWKSEGQVYRGNTPDSWESLISGCRKCTSVTESSICSSARIGGTIRPTRRKISVSA